MGTAQTTCNRLSYIAGTFAITLLILCLASAAFWFEKQRHLERASIATGNMAELLEENVRNSIRKIDITLQAGRLFFESRSFSAKQDAIELNAFLENLESVSAVLSHIRVVDKHGTIRYGKGISGAEPGFLRDFDFFQKILHNPEAELVISGPLISPISHDWTMIFARRLRAPDGSFAGAVYASMPTTQFQSLLSSVALGPHGAATLRTAQLELIHRTPDTKNAVGSREVSAQLQQAVNNRPEGGGYIAKTAIDGIERSNAYRKVAGYPLYVIVGLATQDYLGNWQENMLIIAGLAALAILVSAIAAYRNYLAQSKLSATIAELTQLEADLRHSLEERRLLNEQLAIRARQAESASVAKSAFLANMSHEMRTPLNHIEGMATLIQRESLVPSQRERMEKLKQASRHMAHLISTVLEFTKIDSETADFASDTLDLPRLVMSAMAPLRDEAQQKGITLKIEEIPPVEGLTGDTRYIGRALSNYLSNAIRFTQTGQITLRTLKLDDDESSALIRFEVEDTGPGIAEDAIPRLFSAFEQADNSSTRRYGGLGLGLAITKKIAQALGGDAGCSSRLGVGSLFWFNVRLSKRQAAAPV